MCPMTDQKPDRYLAALAASGKVPGLTKPCPNYQWHLVEIQFPDRVSDRCPICGLSGTVPVSEAEALVALLDWCHAHEIGVAQSLSEQWRWEVKRHPTREWFYGATLAEAVARALGVVRDGE